MGSGENRKKGVEASMSEDSRPNPDPPLLTTEALLREITHLKELTDEKFIGRDLALIAPLQAAKEAVSKSEASTSKQIDAQKEAFDDLRNRFVLLEGRSTGHTQSWGI